MTLDFKCIILYDNLQIEQVQGNIELPGQTSNSHFSVNVKLPAHSLPPCNAGCDIVRFKVFIPSPHVTEHLVSDQSTGDNSQSTKF